MWSLLEACALGRLWSTPVFVLMDNTGRTSNNLLSSASLTPKNTPYLDSNLWLHSPFSRMPILFSTFWWILSCWSMRKPAHLRPCWFCWTAGPWWACCNCCSLDQLQQGLLRIAKWSSCGSILDRSCTAGWTELCDLSGGTQCCGTWFSYFLGFLHRLPPNLRVAASWSPELTQRRQARYSCAWLKKKMFSLSGFCTASNLLARGWFIAFTLYFVSPKADGLCLTGPCLLLAALITISRSCWMKLMRLSQFQGHAWLSL